MSNPLTTSAGYSIASSSNVTTVIWGTDGMWQASAGAGYAGTGYYIVESADQETDAEVIHLENGTGQKVSRIIINNGQRWTLTVQDDSNMTPPQVGDIMSILDGAGLISGSSSTKSAYNTTVVSSGERFTKKGAAMRNLSVERLTLVD